MPELPDLQAFSHNLHKKLSGKTIEKVTVVNDAKLKSPEKDLKKSFEKQKLKKVYREGKELRFEFANGEILGLHLMLNGDLHLFKEKNSYKNTIIELLFDDGAGLALTDWQGIANATLNPEPKDAPDALDHEVNYNFLKTKFEKSKAAVKSFLLDQKKIRGIGNAYADEILWDAGISPFSACNKIPEDKVKELAKSIKKVLTDAEKQILKADPDIISGEIREFLNIHNSKKTHSPTGAKIEYKKSGMSKTYYTDEQELYK